MGSDIGNLFENAESDPLWQRAGLLANASPRPAEGYITVPLAWLARVLDEVHTPTHLAVAMLIYRECLVRRQNTVALPNGESPKTRGQPIRQISGPGLATRDGGDRDREGQRQALGAGDFALVPVAARCAPSPH